MGQTVNPTDYLAELAPMVAPSTLLSYRQRLDRFTQWLGNRTPSSQICAEWVKTALEVDRLSKRSIRQYLDTIRAFLAWQVERGHLKTMPVLPTKRLAGPAAVRQVFTLDEYSSLLAAAGDTFWRYGIMAGWETGLRLGDVACLQWSQVSTETASVKLVPGKTKRFGKQVEIPIGADLVLLLMKLRLAGGQQSEFVCPPMATLYATDQHRSLSSQFGRLVARAGVVGKSFHCLRHSAITRWVANGATVETIASMTGQSYQQILGYTHLSLEEKRKACGL
jgi:integrase